MMNNLYSFSPAYINNLISSLSRSYYFPSDKKLIALIKKFQRKRNEQTVTNFFEECFLDPKTISLQFLTEEELDGPFRLYSVFDSSQRN